jgi:chitin disaccharide deacetylase
MLRRLGLLLMVFALLGALPATAQTYAERLGWGKDDRVIIMNSDDLGMSYGTNQAIYESLEAGITTSTSIMAACPWVPDALTYYKKNPDICVGAHLQMCSEWDYYRFMPVAGVLAVPSLADEMGCLHDNNRLFVEHAKPEEVGIELRAQVDRLEKMGFKLSHINSHMWSLFETPEIMEHYVSLAIEKQLPLRIVGDTVPDGYAMTADPKFIERCKAFTQRVWDAGLPVLDDMHTASYNWKKDEKLAEYSDAIRNLKPGLTEFVVHPTKQSEEMDYITGNRVLLYGDHKTLTDKRLLDVIKEEGVILTSWTEVMKRRQAAK